MRIYTVKLEQAGVRICGGLINNSLELRIFVKNRHVGVKKTFAFNEIIFPAHYNFPALRGIGFLGTEPYKLCAFHWAVYNKCFAGLNIYAQADKLASVFAQFI